MADFSGGFELSKNHSDWSNLFMPETSLQITFARGNFLSYLLCIFSLKFSTAFERVRKNYYGFPIMKKQHPFYFLYAKRICSSA